MILFIFIPFFILLLIEVITMFIKDIRMMYRVEKRKEELREWYYNQPRGIIENECGVNKCHLLRDKGKDVCNECPIEE